MRGTTIVVAEMAIQSMTDDAVVSACTMLVLQQGVNVALRKRTCSVRDLDCASEGPAPIAVMQVRLAIAKTRLELKSAPLRDLNFLGDNSLWLGIHVPSPFHDNSGELQGASCIAKLLNNDFTAAFYLVLSRLYSHLADSTLTRTEHRSRLFVLSR